MNTKRICPSCQKALPPDVPLGLCPECLIKAGFQTGTDPGSPARGFIPPPVEEIVGLFPQLEIVGYIGKGGMGAVYKARQPSLDRFVALKILPPDVANDPGFAERFNREARALARLNHPNIVSVHDFGKVGQSSSPSASKGGKETIETGKVPVPLHYLIMEFVDGTNLREVQCSGRLAPEQALAIVPQICEALQFAHNEGIVHRDIKPENILLDKRGRVKITDFGIAKILGVPAGKAALTGARDIVGTPHYMAPEQIEKPQTVDHRADIYSLGVVFYEMLTGELPLGRFAAPSKKVHVDVRLDEVVLHALEKEPERRYQQASQVKTDVETIAGSPATAPSTQSRAEQDLLIARVQRQVRGPAIGMFVAGIVQLLTFLALLVLAIPAVTREGGNWAGYTTVGVMVALSLGAALLVLLGGFRMMNLRNYTLAVVSSVVAAISGPAAVVGLPIGIWALVVLTRRSTQEAFQAGKTSGGPVAATTEEAKMAEAREELRAPAVGLILVGVLNVVLQSLGFVLWGLADMEDGQTRRGLLICIGCVLAISISVFTIYAAVRMMSLRGRTAALVASVLAMFFGGACIVGLPVGLWALVVLTRRHVREAMAVWQGRLSGDRGIDRTAKLAAVGLTALVIVSAVRLISDVAFKIPGRSDPPFPILSVRRQIGDHLHAAQLHWDTTRVELDRSTEETVWHFAGLRKSSPGGDTNTTVPTEGTLRLERNGPGRWRARGEGELSTIKFAVLVIGGPTRGLAIDGSGFGPVVERVICRDEADEKGFAFFDLETGRTMPPPFTLRMRSNQGLAFIELTAPLEQWIRANHMDVLICFADQTWSTMNLRMQEDFVEAKEWSQVTTQMVADVFARWDALHQARPPVPAANQGIGYHDQFGRPKAFRTRSNTTGVMQWAGLSTTPRSVTIRYRLVAASNPEVVRSLIANKRTP